MCGHDDYCLQVIAEYLQKIDPKSDGAKRDWVAIYDECATVLYQVTIFLLLVHYFIAQKIASSNLFLLLSNCLGKGI